MPILPILSAEITAALDLIATDIPRSYPGLDKLATVSVYEGQSHPGALQQGLTPSFSQRQDIGSLRRRAAEVCFRSLPARRHLDKVSAPRRADRTGQAHSEGARGR